MILRTYLLAALLLGSASGWLAAPAARPSRPALRNAASPLRMADVDVADLPMRPPMVPGAIVDSGGGPGLEPPEPEEDEENETKEERAARVKAEMDAAVIGDANSAVAMDRLKADEDNDGGVSELLGSFLNVLDPTGTVRRRLWTRADFMHIHAVTGAYFLFLGIPWLVYSHVVNALDTSVPMETSSWFLTSLLLAGLVNALSAVPMSRFSSNKIMDLKVRLSPPPPHQPPPRTSPRPAAPTGPEGERLHLRRHRPHVHVPVHRVVVQRRLPRRAAAV